jgi:hypothetical protein
VEVSERPWNAEIWSGHDPARYCAACLIDLNEGVKAKERCHLPVYEPGGALSRRAVHAAAAVLTGARGGVDAPHDARRAAARRLIQLYRDLRQAPPESLILLANSQS